MDLDLVMFARIDVLSQHIKTYSRISVTLLD